MTSPVFHDPGGSRAKWLRALTVLGAFLLLAVFGAFAWTLSRAPRLPVVSSHPAGRIRVIQGAERARLPVRPVRPAQGPGRTALGFYTPWQASSLSSLRRATEHLTDLSPEWFRLDERGGLDASESTDAKWPANAEVRRIAAANRLRVLPLLMNGADGRFDPVRAHRLLSDPARRADLIARLNDLLPRIGAAGVCLDLEDLDEADAVRYPAFVAELAAGLKTRGLVVTACVQPTDDSLDLAALARPLDYAVLMAYDRHAEDTAPGPIAPLDWSDEIVDAACEKVPADQLVLGVGNYAYDWTAGSKDPAESLSYAEALDQAEGYREPEDRIQDVVDWDPTALNAHYDYDDDAGRRHEVWMLDAASAWNQWRSARARGLRGVGLWALGSEDPDLWSFFDPARLRADLTPKAFARPAALDDVQYLGRGDILQVVSEPTIGERKVEMDGPSGLVTDLEYARFPSGTVVRRSGYRPKELALTFDDGPDPVWTPRILDELKRLNVPATFFVIGQNAEAAPGLVRRMVDEGHEVGSHSFTHPNLGEVDDRRIELELNATERAIEAITGRSTLLFRPPYNADSTPTSAEELRPVVVAARHGYLTVGESVDPNDWDLTGPRGDAKAAQIVRDVVAGAEGGQGEQILLHDGGGDREATVKALAGIVETLRAKGYRFVPTSELAGLSRDRVMPRLTAREQAYAGLDGWVMASAATLEGGLALLFTLAILLGMTRAGLVLVGALRARRRALPPAEGPIPSVTFLVAAYNEAAVIERTVRSLLESRGIGEVEVIVVDDGSTDGTAARVPDDPRVRVIEKTNGGKASALNLAIAEARGEVAIGVDADTLLDPDAAALLARWFRDPEIGAVAGNVRVGNADNALTKWQAVEYTTSQNLDRRALALVNAVTVVPGAIGAWRLSALRDAKGYASDTLAEDMDLTWRLRMAGWRIADEPRAVAWTEAPDRFGAFVKQRFRWTFGVLQCLWKHRRAVGRYGWFGRFALPSLWVFGIVFQVLAPLIDLQLLGTIIGFLTAWFGATSHEVSRLPGATASLALAGTLYLAFLSLEMFTGWLAYRWEGRSARPLLWLPLQRFVYRQTMYLVAWRALRQALFGRRQGWGKLERTGTAKAG